MLDVVGTLKSLHKHVIDVYLHSVSDLLLEDLIGHSLEGSSGVLQSEGHYFVAVDFLIGDECCLVFIIWIHLDLIVFRVYVHKDE